MIKYCCNCKWSFKGADSYLQCFNPNVLKKYFSITISQLVDGPNYRFYVYCFGERKKKFFGVCGRKGKLYEEKKG